GFGRFGFRAAAWRSPITESRPTDSAADFWATGSAPEFRSAGSAERRTTGPDPGEDSSEPASRAIQRRPDDAEFRYRPCQRQGEQSRNDGYQSRFDRGSDIRGRRKQ